MSDGTQAGFYVRNRGRVTGPHPVAELVKMVRRGALGRSQEVSADAEQWTPASEIAELFGGPVSLGEPRPAAAPSYASSPSAPDGSGPRAYYRQGDETFGPMPAPLLKSLATSGKLAADAVVWEEGGSMSRPARSHPLLAGVNWPGGDGAADEYESGTNWSVILAVAMILLVVGGVAAGIWAYHTNNSASSSSSETVASAEPAASTPSVGRSEVASTPRSEPPVVAQPSVTATAPPMVVATAPPGAAPVAPKNVLTPTAEAPSTAAPVATALPPGTTLPPGAQLPPGTTLPPGMQAPPGTTVPPGTAMPPGMTVPPGTTLPPGTQLPPSMTMPPGAAPGAHPALDTGGLPGVLKLPDSIPLPNGAQLPNALRDMRAAALPQVGAAAPPGFITNIKDDAALAQAVGLVVVGASIQKPGQAAYELDISTGSCFAASPDGFLVTNNHVVEQDPKFAEFFKSRGAEFTPQIWVFFGKNRYVGKVVFASPKKDLAVVKVDRLQPFFRLNGTGVVHRNADVIALGFPGVGREPLSAEELRRKQSVESVHHANVAEYFNDRDFDYSLTRGVVSRVFADIDGTQWIQHEAVVRHGNSGGALIMGNGVVVGVNTRLQTNEQKDVQTNNSFEIKQFKESLNQYIPTAMWVNAETEK